jgi:hypothetical protein
MSLQLYDRVALRASFPEHALRAGDVATLVDFVDHPSSGPADACWNSSTRLVSRLVSSRCPKTPSRHCARMKSSQSVR